MSLMPKGLLTWPPETGYALHMPVVQELIMRTLQEAHEALTMADLVERVRHHVAAQSTVTIRAAVLPLITLRRVELTAERKLRLKP
jgi:hypothetical protein